MLFCDIIYSIDRLCRFIFMNVYSFIKNLRLRVKVSLLGIGSVLITAAALVSLAVWQSGQYNWLAQTEVDNLINSDLNHIAQGIYNLVQTENEAVQQQLNGNINVMRHLIASAGGISLSDETVGWMAKNQFNGADTLEVRLPKILVGGRWIGMNEDPGADTAVIDMMERLTGETSTIFQRMNERGDMLRVATTVKTAGGRRAIGTYIPAVNPDGSPNAVISTVMSGATYRGTAFVVNTKYLTAYEPFKDKAGNIIGMIYVGIRQSIVESRVRHAVLQTSVGRTGYVYVIGATDEFRGRYIISYKGERDGEDIWDNKDSDGRYVIQSIVSKAVALKPGEFATERYRWLNPGETEPRWKIARIAYFAPWDWVIGVSVYEDELQNYRAVLENGRAKMTRVMSLAGLMITILIGFICVFISFNIVYPVQQITRAAESFTNGDLDQTVAVHSSDEIGMLANTFNFMTAKIKETMAGLRKSEEELQRHRDNLEEMVRERTNELAAAKELADSANRAKSLFLANMSHELRTPMNVILGFAHIMNTDSDITTKQKENINLILKSSEHLLGVINNILDIAKIESGKFEMEPSDFDLGELINNTIAMLRVRAEAKNIKIELDQSSSFPRYVNTDPAKLRQIIINLVGNAIKFTGEGLISIKLGTQSLETEQNRRRLFFEISDTGIGISPGDIERIFQPFAQIGYHEGTGLGLPITMRYVELLGGTISVASEPGRGSTFSFTISYNSVDHNNIQITPASAGRVIGIENASNYRILIVEDQMENRMLLRNLLSPFGFQISEAADGREGIQIFEQWRPHLIFIDRRMPVMDGLQAVSDIRKISAPVRPAIIAVTAHAFKEERQEMLDAGCDGFIAKPFTAEDIFFSLENYLHVNLIRAEDNAQGTPCAPPDRAALAGLPQPLRLDLEAALVRLDIDLIGELIKKIAALNPDLGNTLEQVAGRFDFKPILKTLQQISEEKHEQP